MAKARYDALDWGRPQLDEMIEFMDRQIFSMEANARASFVAYGRIGDHIWARQLVTWDALLRFLTLVKTKDAAVAKVLRGNENEDGE